MNHNCIYKGETIETKDKINKIFSDVFLNFFEIEKYGQDFAGWFVWGLFSYSNKSKNRKELKPLLFLCLFIYYLFYIIEFSSFYFFSE